MIDKSLIRVGQDIMTISYSSWTEIKVQGIRTGGTCHPGEILQEIYRVTHLIHQGVGFFCERATGG